MDKIDRKIQRMKQDALDLKEMADSFPAVYRNTSRILASIKMLEMNVSDLISE